MAINGSLLANANASSPAFIESSTIIGSVAIKGNFAGTATATGNTLAIISAAGGVNNGKADLAISSVTIGGNVDLANILAGYTALSLTPFDPNAQIGTVSVTGNWTAGNIITGTQNTTSNNVNFGDANDAADHVHHQHRHAAVDHYIDQDRRDHRRHAVGRRFQRSFWICRAGSRALRVGGSKITLTAGASNDDIALGTTGDFNLHEIT